MSRRLSRSRANSFTQRYGSIAEDDVLDPPTRSTIPSRLPSGQNSPRRELAAFDFSAAPRPPANPRALAAFEPTSSRSASPVHALPPRLTRAPTDPTTHLLAGRSGLRAAANGAEPGEDVFGDDARRDLTAFERLERSRTGSFSSADAVATKKPPPPPPPPSRSKKPPPPPPLKRSALSTSEIPRY